MGVFEDLAAAAVTAVTAALAAAAEAVVSRETLRNLTIAMQHVLVQRYIVPALRNLQPTHHCILNLEEHIVYY
jgi:hypothetical protein